MSEPARDAAVPSAISTDTEALPTNRLATIARALVTLTVIAVLVVCYFAREILAPTALALLLSLLFSPVVTALERLRLPRAVGSGIVVFALVLSASAAIASLAAPARDWVTKAPAAVHSVKQRMREWRGPFREAQEASDSLAALTQAPGQTGNVVVKDQPPMIVGILSNTPHVLGAIAAVILLIYFFLSSGDNFLRRLVEIAPSMSEKRVVVSIARDVQREISRYLLTISIINFGLGCATAIAAMLWQVPNALLWGALACVLNFAPYIGATITGCVLGIVAFSTFDSLGHALAVPATFFLLAFIEGQLVTPTVIGHRLAVNPVVVFLWLVVWGWLWGIVGVLLAGPLLACFRIVCQHTEALRPIYLLIGEANLEGDNGNARRTAS